MRLSGLQFQLDAFHASRFPNAENLGIQFSVLHLPIICPHPLKSRTNPGWACFYPAMRLAFTKAMENIA
jgi:hypothetical protein